MRLVMRSGASPIPPPWALATCSARTSALESTGLFPEIRGTMLGVPVIRTIIFWGLYWGTPLQGNYHSLAGAIVLLLRALLSLLQALIETDNE